jgi:hypothetical protein
MNENEQLKARVAALEGFVAAIALSDKYRFAKNVMLADDINIILCATNGTKIGTSATQKLAFWNATPVVRPATVNTPSGGTTIDTEARTAIGTLITRLKTLGLIA